MRHLRYSCVGAFYAGEERHPQTVMRALGITYEKAIPQSMGDQWWFFNCKPRVSLHFIVEMKANARLVEQYELPQEYKND